MRNRAIRFLGLASAAVLLAGCAKTPDQAVVREKNGGIVNYQEAETDVPGAAAGEGVPLENDGSDGAGADVQGTAAAPGAESGGTEGASDKNGEGALRESTDSTNALARRLQAPERYKASVSSEDGSFELDCDAQVLVPDVEKVPVWKVSQREFTQEWIDKVTDAFFGDAPVYNETYFERTKEQIQSQLSQLKAWQAEGNYDPYDMFVLEDSEPEEGNAAASEWMQSEIDMLEEAYGEAPDEKDRTEVKPGFGNSFILEEDENGQQQMVYKEDGFVGAVETDGGFYRYKIGTVGSAPMEINISRWEESDLQAPGNWFVPDTGSDNPEIPPEEKLRTMAGITQEEAQAAADAYMEKLGLLQEFSAKHVNLCIQMGSDDMYGNDYHLKKAGWKVSYTRDLAGFPVTDEENMGGGLESKEDMTTETWNYERIEFVVNADGLQDVLLMNLYDVGEKQVENVELLSFPEVADIFEQMMQIQNADLQYDTYHGFFIDHVELGYARIYDPGADSRSGLLVPVWDFFGSKTIQYDSNGEQGSYIIDRAQNSFMTINAADGTVIDRGLGY